MGGTEVMYWSITLGRDDFAVARFARYLRETPYAARQLAFDPHFAKLHCDATFVEYLRALKVEEPHLSAPCPNRH